MLFWYFFVSVGGNDFFFPSLCQSRHFKKKSRWTFTVNRNLKKCFSILCKTDVLKKKKKKQGELFYLFKQSVRNGSIGGLSSLSVFFY